MVLRCLTRKRAMKQQTLYRQPSTQAFNFNLHTAGWLEGGLCMSYEKFVMDADQAGMMRVSVEGIDMSENGQAMDAIHEVGPQSHFLGCEHTKKNFKAAFYMSGCA